MKLRRVAGTSAIAVGIGLSALTVGVGLANAAPPPPGCNNPQYCQNQNGPQQGPPQGPQHDQGPQHQGPPPDQHQGPPRDPHQGPPPPAPGRDGWNDGPPVGGPPPGWNGPPPPDGWNGPPPAGGWNRQWNGPDRFIDQARIDHQPFNYFGYQAQPIYQPDQGGWGFWFLGQWIPL
jgi:hypothetical protein